MDRTSGFGLLEASGTRSRRSRGTFVAEFEAWKVEEVGNLTVAFIAYGKERSGYKAVLRGRKLIAIVSEKYEVVPNEEVIEKVVPVLKERGFSVTVENSERRVYITGVRSDMSVVVANSIDATLAFTVYVGVPVEHGGYAVLGSVKAAHVGRNVRESLERFTEMLDMAEKLREEYEGKLDRLRQVAVDPEYVKMLVDELPRKYTVGVVVVASREKNLYSVFSVVASRIWKSRDAEFRTKLAHMRKLIRWAEMVSGLELL